MYARPECRVLVPAQVRELKFYKRVQLCHAQYSVPAQIKLLSGTRPWCPPLRMKTPQHWLSEGLTLPLFVTLPS